ncbi:MAG: NADH-quinone oxidoreductase subunit L, partial [Pseudomonadota bacterium]
MYTILLFAPLIGALIVGLFGRTLGEKPSMWITTGLLILSAILSWIAFLGHHGETEIISLARWIDSGTMTVDWSIRVDTLTVVMLVVVTTVSSLVHLYS